MKCMKAPRSARAILFACSLAALAIATAAAVPGRGPGPADRGSDAERLHWKEVDEGQLKIDDKTPLTWAVYQPEKKKDSSQALILLGRRYIALDLKTHQAFQVTPGDLQKQGADFESDDLRNSAHLIPSTEWIERDVGPAMQIKLTLEDYGCTIEITLPHPIDLRYIY